MLSGLDRGCGLLRGMAQVGLCGWGWRGGRLG